MVSTKKLFGARIRELRKGLGLSQEDFAEKVDVDHRHISRIELGQNFPELETIEKIASALNVEIRDLFDFQCSSHDTEIKMKLNIEGVDKKTKQLILRITKAVTRAVTSND